MLAARGISTEIQLEYRLRMVSSAHEAVLRYWLERDCAETPEELYDIL